MTLAALLECGQLDGARGDMALFTNTTAEHPATYDFVRRMADVCKVFGVPVLSLRYVPLDRGSTYEIEADMRMDGSAFEAMISKKRYVPNVFVRLCTVNLKVMVKEAYLRDRGIGAHVQVMGFRADEPRRVAKLRARNADVDFVAPLHVAGVRRADVNAWWARQDRAVRPHYPPDVNVSNCVYCFLKGSQLVDLHRHIRDWESTLPDHVRAQCDRPGPHRIEWWQEIERKHGRIAPGYDTPLGFFAQRAPINYRKVIMLAQQPDLGLDIPSIECMACTD